MDENAFPQAHGSTRSPRAGAWAVGPELVEGRTGYFKASLKTGGIPDQLFGQLLGRGNLGAPDMVLSRQALGEDGMKPIELTVGKLHKEGVDAITLWPFILYRRAKSGLPSWWSNTTLRTGEARRGASRLPRRLRVETS